MAGNLYIGIDVGTTSVKAGVIDTAGVQISSFTSVYPTQQVAPGRMEQNPSDWCNRVEQALQQFQAEGLARDVAAVGLCSQVNTHVFVDVNCEPLLPAILWSDVRASSEAAALEAQVSDQQKLAWWGAPMPIDASHVLSRMAWVARHHPALWARTRYVLQPKDMCILQLTGEVTGDPLSSIGLVDQNQEVITGVLDLVPGARDKIPRCVGVTDVVGQLRADMPMAGKPVVTGTMDAWAGLLGCGGHRQGAQVYLSGTSEILGITAKIVHPAEGVIVFPECEDLRIHAGPTQSGGAAKAWFCQQFNLQPEAMAELAGSVKSAAHVPVFLPQLQGERAPLWNPNLRAAFLGIGHKTGLAELARAVYEGVAFSALHILQALEQSAGCASDFISCGGGGFQSDVWNQIRADILGRPLRRLAMRDPGILGAAGLAAFALSEYNALGEVFDQFEKYDTHYEPDFDRHSRYRQVFELYLEALTRNADWHHRYLQVL